MPLSGSPPTVIKPLLGEGATRLFALLLWRVQQAVQRVFVEERPLYLAGALLTRLQPPSPTAKGSGYSVAHVDQANVASYDFSAVLYLNSKDSGFHGGDFCFVDEEGDEVVEPRAGRCVMFPSGFQQLHQVRQVTRGNRFALAVWFTLTASASDGPLSPAHFEVVDPVTPPSREEAQAEGVNLDRLRASVERMMERVGS
jgi:hypothetical protein|mmetsp:Transcript_50057/g.112514  ORF Transcript_50057/g.112514 Transcript_50057/m.112514 type:complete len:199 (-) Transcript_50057:180-776(-)